MNNTDRLSSESKNGTGGFSREQQNYLQGFALGADVARATRGLPILSDCARNDDLGTSVTIGGGVSVGKSPAAPEAIAYQAMDRFESAGQKLCKEEQAKQSKNALDMWDQMRQQAAEEKFPSGTDVFLTKFHGLFYVAPAHDAYMCRARIAGGELNSFQLHGLADLADKYAGGYVDVTTRANLQLREISAADPLNVLVGLRQLGIVNQGSGGDNVRNITATPTSGFDPAELIETLPLATDLNWHLLNHRELYGLPRKFNISFDGGGTISPLSDTNDVGFMAFQVTPRSATDEVPAGIYMQLQLGGITGHLDFSRPTGVLVKPEQCSEVSAAILRVFVANGDRTDRKKARLKYLLDDWGFERFLVAVEEDLGWSLLKFPLEQCNEQHTAAENRMGHIGFHPQKQPDKSYVGVVVPVGRIRSSQLRGLADIAAEFGEGIVRLTVWQNLLIPHIENASIDTVKQRIEALDLDWQATKFRAGLVACTGNAGCKFASADTKAHGMYLADFLQERLDLDLPLNIHLTGCHHSCAQHYIGDIGLLGTSVEVGDDMVEGYDIALGGGWGKNQNVARVLFPAIAFEEVPALLLQVVQAYLDHREDGEAFVSFAGRTTDDVWNEYISGGAVAVN